MSRKTHVRLGALVASLALATAACSSSDGALDGSGTTEASAVEAAKAAVEEYKKPPTKIGISEPLNEAPKPGLLVNISCADSNCVNTAEGAKAAAAAAGWDYEEIPFDNTDPATLLKGLEEALEMNPKPDGVTFTGVDRSQWEQIIPKYEAAGIKIIPGHIGDTELGETVIASIARDENGEQGKMLADWAVADSNGEANVLVMNVPAFPVLKKFSEGFDKQIADTCPGCKVTHLDAAITDVASGAIPGQIVSMIQQDPEIDYVISSVGDFAVGIDSALKSAGLADKVKLAGEAAGAPQRAGIKNGTEEAWTALCFQYNGWQIVDTLLRDQQGMEHSETAGLMPKQLLDKSNIGENPEQAWCEPADYAEQFKALWLVK
ncbi:sugar ABC transporter substrate-binding protein [Nocardioides sp. SYSU DS0651]|uniref:sugar ABC transporter substrate-binding protein n=1 Tax=Nocardioides sp. SYSU DS0651 TaxID=3415955 RepID=UPI003F4C5A1F